MIFLKMLHFTPMPHGGRQLLWNNFGITPMKNKDVWS